MELTDDVYNKIVILSEKGDDYAEKEQFTSALVQYNEALSLLPEPKTDWEAATWLYTAIGDAYFGKQNFEEALNAFEKALMSPDGTGNPYIWFSIGQVFFEQKNIEKAKTHFLSAYMLDGDAIFKDENPEYFKLIKEEVERSQSIGNKAEQRDVKPDNSWLPPNWNEN
jgi:tetratricopeptide (TPR) repeat protein